MIYLILPVIFGLINVYLERNLLFFCLTVKINLCQLSLCSCFNSVLTKLSKEEGQDEPKAIT